MRWASMAGFVESTRTHGIRAARRVRARLASALLLAALPLVSPALAHAADTLYVASAGNDESGANTCQAQASPCATLEHAVSEAGAGDTIEIGPGEYHEAIETTVELHLVGSGSSGADRTLLVSSGESVPGVWMKGGGSIEDVALSDDFPGIGGDLQVDGGAVTASHISVHTEPSPNGTDAIDVVAGSLSLSGSTATAVNSDEVIEHSIESKSSGEIPVLNDGSALEVHGGTATVTASTLEAQRGIALRVHGTATGETVSDSVLTSSGAEDLTGPQSAADGWPVIEAGGGLLHLIGDTVYNATLGNSEEGRPPADALMVEHAAGIEALLTNTIVRAQPGGYGTDIDTLEQVGAEHSSFTTTTVSEGGSVTSPDADGNIPGDPQLAEPATGDYALAPGSPLVGAGDATDVQAGETDVTGAPRESTCEGGLDVLDIGAYESPAPQCPAGPPTLEPGAHSYLYVGHGVGSEGQGYEQLLLGEGGALSPLAPFDASPAHAVAGRLVAGADSPQVYASEEGVLQQYLIGVGGELSPGTTIEAPSGAHLGGAALGADGRDLYVLVTSGSGASKAIGLSHERVSAAGAISVVGTPIALPSGTAGAIVAVAQTGRVYVLANHEAATEGEEPTATLYDYRVDPDGTLAQAGSIALAHSGDALTVAPDGSEAVVTRSASAKLEGGELYPFKVTGEGEFLAEPAVPSGDAAAGHGHDNNPTAAVFSPDSSTLYVADEDEVEGFESVEVVGSFIAPFAVGAGGELVAETPTPNPNEAGSLSAAKYEFEGGLAVSPDGTSLYAPNDYEEPTAGTIAQFTIGAHGALAPKSPAQVAGEPYQGSVALVAPPETGKGEEKGSGGETGKGETSTNKGQSSGSSTSTVLPPPPPPSGAQGIAGIVTAAATHAPVPGVLIDACPRNKIATGVCVEATTDGSGHYALATAPGVWLVQVDPPGSELFPASVEATVPAGAQTTQNFALSAPHALTKGVVFDTPSGVVANGVPTVNWATPFSFTAPAGAPKREPPGTDLLVTHLVGLSSNTSSAQGKAFGLAGAVLYGVHYDATGKPSGMTEPIVAQIACNAACAQLAGTGTPSTGDGIVLAHGSGSATLIVVTAPDGKQVALTVTYYYTPGLASGKDPLSEVSVDLGSHESSNSDDLEQTVDEDESELEKEPGEHHEGAAYIDDDEDDAGVDVSSIDESTHGGVQWYDDETSGEDGPQPSDAGSDDVSVYSADDTRLDDGETAADEQEALDVINDYLKSKGEAPLDSEETAMYLSALNDYVKEAGALDLTHPTEDDNAEGLFDFYERVEDEIKELDLPPEYEQLLYKALEDAGPRLFPKATHDLEEEEREVEEEEAREAEAERRHEDEKAKEAPPDDEPDEPLDEPDEPDEDDEGDVFIDPSGLVESTAHVPLAGALVTLSRSAKPKGRLLRVPGGSDVMSPGNRRNPSRTTIAGLFAWDTIPGYYRIAATHPGCAAAHTDVFSVPPPRSNLVLKLRCRAIHRRATRVRVHVARSRTGTLALKIAVAPTRGRAPAGALLGTVSVSHGGRTLIGVGLDARGRALVDIPGKLTASSLTISYSGNGLYAPAGRHG